MLRIGLCDDDKEYMQKLMEMIRRWTEENRKSWQIFRIWSFMDITQI